MNIFNVSIDISVVFTLYSTQSAGIAVLFVFFTAIYQTIVVFLEIIMLLYQVSMQIELREKNSEQCLHSLLGMLCLSSWLSFENYEENLFPQVLQIYLKKCPLGRVSFYG